MNKQSDEIELHEIFEEQRGAYCKISSLFFITIMIGLGIITAAQEALGDWTVAVDIIFIIAVAVVFLIIVLKMVSPIDEVTKVAESKLKDILERALPEDEEEEIDGSR